MNLTNSMLKGYSPQARVTLNLPEEKAILMANAEYADVKFLVTSVTLIGPVDGVYSAAIGLGFDPSEIFEKLDSVDDNGEYAQPLEDEDLYPREPDNEMPF